MQRCGRARALGTEGGEVTVSSSAIDNRGRVKASSSCSLGISKSDESVAFRAAGVFVDDDDGFQDITELLEVTAHSVALGLPSEATHEYFGEGGVAKHAR